MAAYLFNIEKCRVMDVNKTPFWVSFNEASINSKETTINFIQNWRWSLSDVTYIVSNDKLLNFCGEIKDLILPWDYMELFQLDLLKLFQMQ
jgi:hypothetical protein